MAFLHNPPTLRRRLSSSGWLTLRLLAAVLISCGLAALILWFGNRYQRRAEARHAAEVILNVLSTSGESDLDLPALRQLLEAPRDTRQAALELLLSSDDHLPRFSHHAHAVAISLSQVRADEAEALARDIVIPAFRSASYPPTLQAASYLFLRWSIADALSPSERESLAEDLLERMADGDPAVLDPLSKVLIGMAPRLPSETKAELLDALAAAVRAEPDPAALHLLLETGTAFLEETDVGENSGDENRRDDSSNEDDALALPFADAIAFRYSAAPDSTTLRVLQQTAVQLPFGLPLSDPSALAAKSIDELLDAPDPARSRLFLPAWDLAAPKLNANQVEEFGGRFLTRLPAEPDPERVSLHLTALGSLTNQLPAAMLEQAQSIALDRMSSASGAAEKMTHAIQLADLSPGAPIAASAALNLAKLLAAERDPYTISQLATGLDALAPLLSPEAKTEAAGLLIGPLLARGDIASQVRLALGFHAVAGGLSPAQTAAFARQVVERMRAASGNLNSSPTLRYGAFLLHAVRDTAPSPVMAQAASIIASRIAATDSPVALSDLTMALYALGRPPSPAAQTDSSSGIGTPAGQLLHRLADLIAADPDLGRRVQWIESFVIAAPMADGATRRESARTIAQALAADLDNERDPLRMRYLSRMLAVVLDAVLTPPEFNRLSRVFQLPAAPCQIAALGTLETRPPRIAAALQNPACEERSWDLLAATFLDDAATGPLVPPDQDAPWRNAPELDLEELAGTGDDDGESSSTETETAIDFLAVSKALSAYR